MNPDNFQLIYGIGRSVENTALMCPPSQILFKNIAALLHLAAIEGWGISKIFISLTDQFMLSGDIQNFNKFQYVDELTDEPQTVDNAPLLLYA